MPTPPVPSQLHALTCENLVDTASTQSIQTLREGQGENTKCLNVNLQHVVEHAVHGGFPERCCIVGFHHLYHHYDAWHQRHQHRFFLSSEDLQPFRASLSQLSCHNTETRSCFWWLKLVPNFQSHSALQGVEGELFLQKFIFCKKIEILANLKFAGYWKRFALKLETNSN